MNNNYIKFEEERNFGEIISATFTFLRQELKGILRALIIYTGPFILLASFFSAVNQTDFFSDDLLPSNDPLFFYSNIFSISYLLSLIFILLSMTMMTCTIFGYISLYVKNGKNNFNFDDLWKSILNNFSKILITQIVVGFAIFLSFFMYIYPAFYLSVALSIIYIVRIVENKSLIDSAKRSIFLISDNWFLTFIVIAVIYALISFASFIFLIPTMALTMFYTMSNLSGEGEVPGLLFTIVMLISTFLSTLLYVVPFTTLGFQYYSLVEKKENPGLLKKINAINEN